VENGGEKRDGPKPSVKGEGGGEGTMEAIRKPVVSRMKPRRLKGRQGTQKGRPVKKGALKKRKKKKLQEREKKGLRMGKSKV